ncbi:autotransporter outer membrane beta-barrel domain-containing protein, partial [Salmonella enterica]|nr:autotransporter outer membrane beta-barrel domain-containing protein [Salmonella enterica]
MEPNRNRNTTIIAIGAIYLMGTNSIAATYNVDEGRLHHIQEDLADITIVERTPEFAGDLTTFDNTRDGNDVRITAVGKRNISYKNEIYGSPINNLELGENGDAPTETLVRTDVRRLTLFGDEMKTVIAEDSAVGEVYGDKNKKIQLKNDGEIGVIKDVEYVINNGVIRDFRGSDELINTKNGIVMLGGPSQYTKKLQNYGTIVTNDTGVYLVGSTDAYNSGRIQGGKSPGLTMGTNGGKIVNDGEITNDYSEDDVTPAITLINRSELLVITNNGTIKGSASAIGYAMTDNSTIINNGIIDGDITRLVFPVGDPEGLNSDITLINNAGGVWTGGFKDSTLGQFNFVNEVQTIENHGTIKPKKDNRTGIPTIRSREIINDGTIDLLDDSLTIIGNYTGRPGAQLVTAGKLGGDETPVNSLRITGTVSGDATQVYVNNLGGTGAATVDGILVVRADTVDGEGFSKGERIVAGAYDYDLVKVRGDGYTEWRLTSELTPEPPGPTPP